MSYESAMEAAGAVVHVSEQFGDYQGTAWAKVTYEGVTGWVSYGYGSCSGCDSWEAFTSDYDYDEGPPADKLAQFGRDYLSPILTQEEAEAEAGKDAEWDSEAENVLMFLRANKVI